MSKQKKKKKNYLAPGNEFKKNGRDIVTQHKNSDLSVFNGR